MKLETIDDISKKMSDSRSAADKLRLEIENCANLSETLYNVLDATNTLYQIKLNDSLFPLGADDRLTMQSFVTARIQAELVLITDQLAALTEEYQQLTKSFDDAVKVKK